MPCGDMFAGEANIFGTVTDFLATFREKGTAVFEGRTLTEFTGDLAHRNAKGILRVGKYIRIYPSVFFFFSVHFGLFEPFMLYDNTCHM